MNWTCDNCYYRDWDCNYSIHGRTCEHFRLDEDQWNEILKMLKQVNKENNND